MRIMKIKRFEEIEAWQEARKLTNLVYKLSSKDRFSKDWGLKDQIQRASVSIMNNISEGFDSGTKPEFIKFLNYAKRSASEVQCNLYIALDQGYIEKENFDGLYDHSEKIRRMISSFIKYLREGTR